MKRSLLPLCCLLVLGAMLALASPSGAQPNCVPFETTTTATLTFLDQNGHTSMSALSGIGTGTIGDYTQSGTALFIFTGQALRFTSHSTILTAAGTISTMEMGSSDPGGGSGRFRLTGGTDSYVGATGSGSFSVVVSPDGTQRGTYEGDLCLPPGWN